MRKVGRLNSIVSTQNFIWIGIGVGMFYWLLESLMHITVFGQGHFHDHVFTPDVHEIWKRLLITVLIVCVLGTLYITSSYLSSQQATMARRDLRYTPTALQSTGRTDQVVVPRQYAQDGRIVLNIGPTAVEGLELVLQQPNATPEAYTNFYRLSTYRTADAAMIDRLISMLDGIHAANL